MILLEKNATNKIAITAKEITTISNPNYLFCFFNEQTRGKEFIYLSKINIESNRFDEYSLTLPSDLDLKSGDYIYSVYESSDLVLNPTNKRLLETGKMRVYKSFPSGFSYTSNTVDTVNYGE